MIVEFILFFFNFIFLLKFKLQCHVVSSVQQRDLIIWNFLFFKLIKKGEKMKKCEMAGGLQHFCAFSPFTAIVEVTYL